MCCCTLILASKSLAEPQGGPSALPWAHKVKNWAGLAPQFTEVNGQLFAEPFLIFSVGVRNPHSPVHTVKDVCIAHTH